MRTGAIFARGSCRALKWLALFGVVSMLGVGTAAAQIDVVVPPVVDEAATVVIKLSGTVPANTTGTPDTVTISFTVTTATGTGTTTDGEAEDFGDFADTYVINRPAGGSGNITIPADAELVWTVGRDPGTNAEDEAVTLTFTSTPSHPFASGATPRQVTIKDTDAPQGFKLTGATSITEGAATATTLTLEASPPKTVDLAGIAFGITPSDPTKYTLGAPSAPTLPAGGSVTVTIEALADGDRADDTLTVTAYGGAPLVTLDTLGLSVTDIHKLPETADINAVAYDAMTGGSIVTEVAEGDTVYLEVTVDRGTNGYPSGEAIEVALTTDASLATLGAPMATVPAGTGAQMAASRVELTAAEVNTFPQTEMLVVELEASGATATNGSGSVDGTPRTLTITDTTVKQVLVKDGAMDHLYARLNGAKASDGMLNPDDEFTVDNDMLFDSAAGFTFQVDARSSMSSVVSVDDSSGDSISVMPESVGGPAMITLTATALPEASSFRDTQVSQSVATIEFEVTVEAVPTARPDRPAAPTVDTAKAQGELDVSWTPPNDNGSVIMHYGLQYKMSSGADWTVMTAPVTGTSTTLTGLSADTSYHVQVNATNADGTSDWSPIGTGKTAPAPAAPDAPAEPTVATAKAQGTLDVSWTAPNDNGSAILDYGLQYRVKGTSNWTVMADAVAGTTATLSGMPASTTYEVQVRARNANGSSDWSKSGEGTTAAPPPKKRGQITAMTFSGGSRGMRTIGGEQRYHVLEGDTTVKLDVTVQWDHAELTELAALGVKTVSVNVRIMGDQPAHQSRYNLPRWVSWIDDEGDVDFPNTTGTLGILTGTVMVSVPTVSDFPDSIRHHKSATGSIALLILHDEHEAEEEAFYIDAVDSPDVDLAASDAANTTSPLAVIEDDEPQEVLISGPSTMHEGEGSKTFTVKADPERLDLPLEVRLSVVDLQGATISGERYSLSDASLVFNPNGDGTTNSLTVELRFPSPDGDRQDDDYKLEAAVVDYSLTSGGFDATVVDDHPIKIVDIHRLPPVTVDAYSSMLMEGDEVTLTLKVDRNPPETPRVDPETNLYTYEALTLELNAAGKATEGEDYEMPTTVAVPEHDGSAPWVQEVKLTVKALDDDDVEMEDESLMVHAIMEGDDPKNGDEPRLFDNLVSLTLTDETTKLVSVRANAYEVIKQALGDPPMLTTGMSADLTGSNLFDYDPNAVDVSYGTPESTDRTVVSPSASGGTITLRAESAGEAKITITATAEPKSSSLMVNQTKANVAQLTFPVMVEDAALVFTLEEPADMNLVEGGMGAMVTVTTNRPVSENTEVMLIRDGSSSASDDDYMLDPPLITIMADQRSGSTMVTAVEDGLMENEGNMAEMLTLFLVVDGMQMADQSVTFYLWDESVPALPIIAQLLLAALMAVGGYRRYRRR